MLTKIDKTRFGRWALLWNAFGVKENRFGDLSNAQKTRLAASADNIKFFTDHHE